MFRSFGLTRRRVAAFAGVYASVALGLASAHRRAAGARADRRGPVHDRRRHRRLPGAARLADERRRARQVRLPVRRERGMGALPPADPARVHMRGRRGVRSDGADRGDRAVRVGHLQGRRGARGAAADRGDAAAAPGARVDRGGLADPRRPLRPPRDLADDLDGAAARRDRDRRAVRRDPGRDRRRDRPGADDDLDPRDRPREPAPVSRRRPGAARRRSSADHQVRRSRARPTRG